MVQVKRLRKLGKGMTEGIVRIVKLERVVPGSEKGLRILGEVVVQMW